MFMTSNYLPGYYLYSEEFVLFIYLFFWLSCIGFSSLLQYVDHPVLGKPQQQKPDQKIQEKQIIPYQDKYKEYMEQIHNSKFIMNEDQLKEKAILYDVYYKEIQQTLFNEYNLLQQNIIAINNELDEEDEYDDEDIKQMINKKEDYHKRLIEYEDVFMKEEYIARKAEDKASQKVYDNLLSGFLNNSIMEYTPNGNVIMRYNYTLESFEYYSDHAIPYQYLEVVARKYVKIFHCGYLYVDMEKHIEKVLEENITKSVFSKQKKIQKEVFLKNRANRYVHSGKIYNFQIIQKLPTKDVSKMRTMSYRDYKCSGGM